MKNISKIQKLDTRKIWEKEPQFSAWLSENIDYLNEVIGLDITIQSTEENVGPYKVDIYGEDVSGAKVIIENQLESVESLDNLQDNFGLVIFAEILEHITFNPIGFWQKIHQAIQVNGIIYSINVNEEVGENVGKFIDGEPTFL